MSDLIVVYAREAAPEEYEASIFLEGPTPTKNGAHSWRTEALHMLKAAGYRGVVFVPESRPDESGNTRFHADYANQLEWERQYRYMADVILAWIPRTREDPGITTNYELGEDMDSGKLVFGTPDNSWKTSYPRYWAERLQVPVASTLRDTVINALTLLGKGARRKGGERFVPLFVWRTSHFQQWYTALVRAGNRLDHAKVVWTWRVGPQRKFTFFWILHVKVWIKSERRHKSNEVVLSRPDISTIVLYQRAPVLDDSLVVLVKEFRSPVSNSTGYVWENAGGSSWKEGVDPLERASEESHEETGLEIDPSRFVMHGARQVVPTLSAHKAHLFSVELTDNEVAWLRSQNGVPRGVIADTERTFTFVSTLREIRQVDAVGWADLGKILHVLAR
jgi:hypothetical protein